MTDLSADDARSIRSAAALLDAVGRCADNETALASIHALHAADLLAAVESYTPVATVTISRTDACTAIGEALRLLATVSDTAFALQPVVDAVDAAQRALQAAE